MLPCRIVAHTATSALGNGLPAHWHSLRERRGGLRENDLAPEGPRTWIGRVDGLETAVLPTPLNGWDCRNNRLAWQALNQDGFLDRLADIGTRLSPGRLGIAVGTSTASMAETEYGYRNLDDTGHFPSEVARAQIHTMHSLAGFLRQALDWQGPNLTVSTACSSGAKAWAVGARWLQQGLCDAVLVGGCDSLCLSTLYGFASLQLTSTRPCRPFDSDRDGISIGEAAAFALLVRADDRDPPDSLHLVGYGESADAHHMSAPHPQGAGARLAIEAALARAGLAPADIDYINLHGTASRLNDEVEATLIASLFPADVPASSTKGWTGHALGAAGALEASLSLLALEHGLVPGTLHCEKPDPACGPQIRGDNEQRPLRHVLSNSFGFGGSNASLILRRSVT